MKTKSLKDGMQSTVIPDVQQRGHLDGVALLLHPDIKCVFLCACSRAGTVCRLDRRLTEGLQPRLTTPQRVHV